MTGIVAETARFSNEKTTSQTMSISAALMAAGANQQLVASKLEEPIELASTAATVTNEAEAELPKNDDGALRIDHANDEPEPPEESDEAMVLPAPAEEDADIGEAEKPDEGASELPTMITEPPSMGGALNSTVQNPGGEDNDPTTDPLSTAGDQKAPVLDRDTASEPPSPAITAPTDKDKDSIEPASEEEPAEKADEDTDHPEPTSDFTPPPPSWTPPATPTTSDPPAVDTSPNDSDDSQNSGDEDSQTLHDLEESVMSPHLEEVRDEVSQALKETTPTPEPIESLNAQPLGDNLHDDTPETEAPTPGPAISQEAAPSLEEQIPGLSQTVDPLDTPSGAPAPPPSQTGDGTDTRTTEIAVHDPTAPPPVPPPLPMQFGQPQTPPQQP
jgi:hypothetical protein